MELLNLFGRMAGERHRSPVRYGGRFIVDRLSNDEVCSARVRVEEAHMPGTGNIVHRLWHSQNTQNRVVELPRPLDVVGAYHCVEQQSLSPRRFVDACGGCGGSEQEVNCELSRSTSLAEWAESSDYSRFGPHEHVATFRMLPLASKRPQWGRLRNVGSAYLRS